MADTHCRRAATAHLALAAPCVSRVSASGGAMAGIMCAPGLALDTRKELVNNFLWFKDPILRSSLFAGCNCIVRTKATVSGPPTVPPPPTPTHSAAPSLAGRCSPANRPIYITFLQAVPPSPAMNIVRFILNLSLRMAFFFGGGGHIL